VLTATGGILDTRSLYSFTRGTLDIQVYLTNVAKDRLPIELLLSFATGPHTLEREIAGLIFYPVGIR